MHSAEYEARKPFYSTEEWWDLRERIVARDGARCRNCGHPEQIEVHHLLPEYEHCSGSDDKGYGLGPNPLIVHETGLVTLCHDCHAALTQIRLDRALKRDPRDQMFSQNIYQLWTIADQNLPIKVVKETRSGRQGQYLLVEKVEIKKWPYGSSWGRYVDGNKVGDIEKVRNSGTYTWAFYQHDG